MTDKLKSWLFVTIQVLTLAYITLTGPWPAYNFVGDSS